MTEENTVTGDDTVSDTQTGHEDSVQAADTPDIDQLLGEYEEKKETAAKPEEKDDLSNIRAELKDLKQKEINREVKAEMESFVSSVRDELPEELKDFDADLIEGFLHKAANDTPKLSLAFAERSSNPNGWANIKKSLVKKVAGKLSALPTRNVAGDRKAAMAAARGVSTTEPSEKEVDVRNWSMQKIDEEIATWPRR